ncbi:MAG: hypothetical protein QOE75_2167 [Solirubrobacterales bacterium]|jgi:hypothetical protein|nr:hypothetical protein [Solirubrobacterales bacterium]
MEPISDNELNEALEALRPEPRPAFAVELDTRVAAGFPRKSWAPGLLPAGAVARLRGMKPRRILLPAGAAALTALLVVAVVVSVNRESDQAYPETGFLSLHEPDLGAELGFRGAAGEAALKAEMAEQAESAVGSSSAGAAEGTTDSLKRLAEPATGTNRNFDGSGPYVRASDRAIERSSQITLGTEPENVGKASSEVFDVVHDYRGVVLTSRTSDGSAAHAEAKFELLIPSGKLGDAMAGFSQIAEVRSRQEATDDITAPTVSATEHLEDSRARIDSLLGQLADAETESEREAVERELREERGRAANLQASLDNLERRASLFRVSLRIVGGEGISSEEGGAWGIGDALHDAGQILGVAAALTLLALAVLGPIALIALLTWLGRRTYLRRARRTALG